MSSDFPCVPLDPDKTLSLCMIVRDNESIIRDCLESIRPWVDEMIVVDTGSVDATADIARELGAQVYEFPWCDDFSAARNESLRFASGKWLFWMDSDDVISPENGKALQDLVSQEHPPEAMAFVMQVHCPGGPESPADKTVVDHVKVFRNGLGIKFEGRIHEQILSDIRALDGEVLFTEIYVTHASADHTPQGRKGKIARDLRCLKLDLEDRPDHPFVLFNLGMTYADIDEHEQAVGWLTRSLEVASPQESHVRKAYALLIHSLHQLEKTEQAHDVCERAIAQFPQDPELQFRLGIIEHALGHHQLSVDAYRSALKPPKDDRYFSSLDPSISGYKARHNLALVYLDLGRPDMAELQWRLAIEDAPHFRHAWRKLGELLIEQQKLESARLLIAQMDTIGEVLKHERALLSGMLDVLAGEHDQAMHRFEAALTDESNEVEVRDLISRFLFHHGRLEDAESALLAMVDLKTDVGSTWHNLGLIYRSMEDLVRAVEAFENSLAHRPVSPPTEALLHETRKLVPIHSLQESLQVAK